MTSGLGLLDVAYKADPTCPECHRPWDQRPELVGKAATDFSDCAFRCHHCGLAFSNATSPQARVLITRTPELNLPSEVRAGLQATLAGSATGRKSERSSARPPARTRSRGP